MISVTCLKADLSFCALPLVGKYTNSQTALCERVIQELDVWFSLVGFVESFLMLYSKGQNLLLISHWDIGLQEWVK